MRKLSSSSIKIAIIGSLNKKISAKLTKVLQDIKVKAEVCLHFNEGNLKDIDIIYLDYSDTGLLLKKLSNTGQVNRSQFSAMLFLKFIQDLTVLKNISGSRYTKAILPLNYGIVLLSKKTYGKEFLNKQLKFIVNHLFRD